MQIAPHFNQRHLIAMGLVNVRWVITGDVRRIVILEAVVRQFDFCSHGAMVPFLIV